MNRRVAMLAALTLAVTAGCAESGTETTAAPSSSASPIASGPPWHDEVAPAEAGATVGAKGSECELPITFSVPADWKVTKVSGEAQLVVGRSTLKCEIDAKPAGLVGFLRVWSINESLPSEGKTDVERFVTEFAKDPKAVYRQVKAGPLDSREASYVEEDLDGKPNPHRAIVVAAVGGDTLLAIGGMDADEFQDLLPGYQLAKRSVRPA
ncbi:lipoprotein [Micromonospora sp. CPCC 205539]|uniref:lipoprotein n=1 Tax=Micromonospora sp. CPCC 205539 TaxID=3122408 RepID=UPI002FF2B6A1